MPQLSLLGLRCKAALQHAPVAAAAAARPHREQGSPEQPRAMLPRRGARKRRRACWRHSLMQMPQLHSRRWQAVPPAMANKHSRLRMVRVISTVYVHEGLALLPLIHEASAWEFVNFLSRSAVLHYIAKSPRLSFDERFCMFCRSCQFEYCIS